MNLKKIKIGDLVEELKNRTEQVEFVIVQKENNYEVNIYSDKKVVHSTSGKGDVTILIIRKEKEMN